MYCACATAKRKQMQRPFSRHDLQLPASKHSRGSHHPAQSSADPTRELQVQKSLHLPRERRAIPVPPNFLDPRQTIRIQILGNQDVERFFSGLKAFDDFLASDHPLEATPE